MDTSLRNSVFFVLPTSLQLRYYVVFLMIHMPSYLRCQIEILTLSVVFFNLSMKFSSLDDLCESGRRVTLSSIILIQLFFLQNRIAPKTSLSFPSKLFTVYDFRQFVYPLVYNIDKFSFRENKVLFIRHIRM